MNPPVNIRGAAAPVSLLYVEDEDNDVLFMRRALARAGLDVAFQTICDGDKAVAYLAGEAPYAGRPEPDLVLLDLNLPARSGFEVLEWIRHHSDFPAVPVVVLSSSGRAEDRERAHRTGADDYLVKPTSPAQLIEIAKELWTRWLCPEARATRRLLSEAGVTEAATEPPLIAEAGNQGG